MPDKNEVLWKVKILRNNDKYQMLQLYDIESILGEYLKLNRNYFDDLIEVIKISKNYSVVKGIHEIIGKDGKNWTENPWLMILAKNNEKNASIWMLIKRENDLNGFLVAIGPDLFNSYITTSKDNIEEINKILEYIVVYYDKWSVSVVIPELLN